MRGDPHGKDSDRQLCTISDYFNLSEYQWSQSDLGFNPMAFITAQKIQEIFKKFLRKSKQKQKRTRIQNCIICKIPDLTRCARGI